VAQASTEFQGSLFERWAVRWHVAYPTAYHQHEGMMEDHLVEVKDPTLDCSAVKHVPLLLL
jgi:hypothetical protein